MDRQCKCSPSSYDECRTPADARAAGPDIMSTSTTVILLILRPIIIIIIIILIFTWSLSICFQCLLLFHCPMEGRRLSWPSSWLYTETVTHCSINQAPTSTNFTDQDQAIMDKPNCQPQWFRIVSYCRKVTQLPKQQPALIPCQCVQQRISAVHCLRALRQRQHGTDIPVEYQYCSITPAKQAHYLCIVLTTFTHREQKFQKAERPWESSQFTLEQMINCYCAESFTDTVNSQLWHNWHRH